MGENGARYAASAQDILGVSDLVVEEVDVPEWGLKVRIRNLSGDALGDYLRSRTEQSESRHAELLARVICDEKGERLFTEKQVEALGKKASHPLVRLFRRANKLNFFDDDSREDIRKNSEAPASDSASA